MIYVFVCVSAGHAYTYYHKVLSTYIKYRAVSGVLRTITIDPHPLSTRTYIKYRAVSGVLRTITIDPHPLSTQRVCPPPAPKAGWRGGRLGDISEDARHWIGLLQYNPSTLIIIFCFSLAWQNQGTLWSESRVGSRESLVEKWRGWLWPQRSVWTSGHFRYKYFLFSTSGHNICEQHFQSLLPHSSFGHCFRPVLPALFLLIGLPVTTEVPYFRPMLRSVLSISVFIQHVR
jgi:hypothetical protein